MPMRKALTLSLLLMGALIFPSVVRAQTPSVRVALLQDVSDARLSVPGPCRLKDARTGAVLSEQPELKWQEVRPGARGVRLGDRELASEAVIVEPLRESEIRLNAKPYRGEFLLLRTASGRITIINRVDLEEYLVGALASEVNADWPIEALRAHAVVSRTAVAHRIWINRSRPFDVTADTRTHLYYGASAERPSTREAVFSTRGEVLAYNGEILSAAFHANCGGHTESASALWDVPADLPPLRGVADPYCRGMRHFTWRGLLSGEQIVRALGELGGGIGTLRSFEVRERDRSGRVTFVRLTGDRGSVDLPGRRFRELLGANRLQSLNFHVRNFWGWFFFDGFGWGHGVGLCQWGAYGMAKKGNKMEEILAFYFPGAEKRKLEGLPGFS